MPICVSDGAICSDTICFGEFSPVVKCASIGKPGCSGWNFLRLKRESKAKLIDLFSVLKTWDLTLRSVCMSRVLQSVWRWQFFAEFDRCGVC